MHEFAIARAVLAEVAVVRAQQCLGSISRVTIELGEFSGVEPVFLQSAFEELSAELLGRAAELVIQSTPLEACCEACQSLFAVKDFQFRCPECRHSDVRITRGEELQLISVDAERMETVP